MTDRRPVVVLLRGINVGGRNKLPMVRLREIAEGCGFDDPRTYVQSGNLLLGDVSGRMDRVAPTLAEAIHDATGLDIRVIVRSGPEWSELVDANPFPDADDPGRTVHVIVLDGPVTSALQTFDAAQFAPERMVLRDSEVFLHLPDGLGRSKLAHAVMRIDNARTGTARNWNTVLAIADLLTSHP